MNTYRYSSRIKTIVAGFLFFMSTVCYSSITTYGVYRTTVGHPNTAKLVAPADLQTAMATYITARDAP